MTYLTPEQIRDRYNFAPVHRMLVLHDPSKWSGLQNFNLPNPIKMKFDVNIRQNMSQVIHDAKGIYMFVVEPEHDFAIDICLKHLMYVGRVMEGATGFNFFRRFYDYVNAIGDLNAAKNKMRLTNLWPDQTFVYFFNLSNKSDAEITHIEDEIINKIVPPLNEALNGSARLTRQL